MIGKVAMCLLLIGTFVVATATPAAAVVGGGYAVTSLASGLFVIPGTFDHLEQFTGTAVAADSPLPGGFTVIEITCTSSVPCTGTIIMN